MSVYILSRSNRILTRLQILCKEQGLLDQRTKKNATGAIFVRMCDMILPGMNLISLYLLSRLVLLYGPGTVPGERSMNFSWTSMCP